MKTRLQRWPGNSALRFSAPALALSLFLVALPAGADTSFTTTNWVAGVPVPGIPCTNGLGQVYLKGNVHVHRVVSADAQIAGRLQAWMDLARQADGTAIFSGPTYSEVGTWAGTNFTPSGGVWDLMYSGVAQADGSDQVHLVGYGIGGAIDGLRVEITATKGPGAPFDPAIPYVSSGTIKAAPLVITDPIDESKAATWPESGLGPDGALIGTNGQLTIHARATWPTIHVWNTTAWASPGKAAAVAPGQTLKTRVELVRLNEAATSAILGIYYASGVGYWLEKAHNHVSVGKQTASGMPFLSCEPVVTGDTNKVLVLALTPTGNNLILTARVLDRANGEAVLYEKVIRDTPASDPSLTAAQVQGVTGMILAGLVTDPAGPPWTTFRSPWLGVFQYTDGTLPAAEVTFDHFEMRTYEVQAIGIQRAVQLTWPATGMSFGVESAPTVNGPWLPVQDSVPPGFQQMTVPQSGPMQFFRLQQAP